MSVVVGDIIKKCYRDETGSLHRSDGPAIIYEREGQEEWWIHGNHISNEVKQWLKDCNITWPFNVDTQLQFDLTWAYNYTEPNMTSPGVSLFIIDD